MNPHEITDNGDRIIEPKPWCFDCGQKTHRFRQPRRVPTWAYCEKKQAWLSYKNPVDFRAMAERI